MKLFQKVSLGFLLTFFFFCYGCQPKTEKINEGLGKKMQLKITDDKNESEPITCID